MRSSALRPRRVARWARHLRRLRVALATGLLLSTLFAQDVSAQARTDNEFFTYASENCTGKKIDPLNVLWYRANNVLSQSLLEVELGLDWTERKGGTQRFLSRGVCYDQAAQRNKGRLCCFRG